MSMLEVPQNEITWNFHATECFKLPLLFLTRIAVAVIVKTHKHVLMFGLFKVVTKPIVTKLF